MNDLCRNRAGCISLNALFGSTIVVVETITGDAELAVTTPS